MAERAAESVLQRKARGGRDGSGARAQSSAKALRLALAREADRLFGLAVTVATIEQLRLPATGIEAEMPDDGLLLLLEGAAGARGALHADAQVMAALIEVQTTGQVRPGTAAARTVTRTDAAMAAPLVDALLAAHDAQMRDWQPDRPGHGLAFGDLIEEARALPLLLMANAYDLFRLTLDLGGGAKRGCLRLLLPVPAAPQPAAGTAKRATGAPPADPRNAALAHVVLGAPVVLDAVLARISLPLGDLCGLRRGAVLPLDPASLSDTELVAGRGHVAARVRLGQTNGWRAVRLHGIGPPDAEAKPRDETATPPEAGGADAVSGGLPAVRRADPAA